MEKSLYAWLYACKNTVCIIGVRKKLFWPEIFMWSLALIDLYVMSSYFSSAQKVSLCQLCPTEWDKPATFNISFSPRQANVNFTVTFMVPQTHAVTSRATYNTGPTGYSYQVCDDVIYTPHGRTVVVTVIVFWCFAALHAWVIGLIFQMFSSESSHWHVVDNEHFSLCRQIKGVI